MFSAGITGGMGSGKSTVARVFEVLGIPVYYADSATRKLMNEDASIRASIIEHFGKESYASNGELNRAYIASIVFSDPGKLTLLNSLTHPASIRDGEAWMKRQKAPYSIKEAALIFESGSNQYLDFVIGVFTPLPLRISRIMARDGFTKEEIMSRIERQMDEKEKMDRCDAVILNDESVSVIKQVLSIHEMLLLKAGLRRTQE